jgi:signal transduction histidine kinase
VDSAGILLREDDRLVARASLGLDETTAAGFSERIGEGFAGTIAATRAPLLLTNAADSPLVPKPWARMFGLRGLLGVPLISDGEVFGVAHIGSVRASDFTADERRLFAAVAERAASAADHVRSRRRVEELLDAEKTARRAAEEAAKRQSFLAEVSAVLASSLDVVTTMTKVAAMAVPALADWCGIDGLGEDRAVVRLAATPSNDESSHVDVHAVIEQRTSARATTAHVSSLCIPLLRRDACVGALTFLRSADRPYSDDEVALGDEVALRVAMAIENAELYRSARDAIQIREDFVSIASHELKTPLTSLKLQLSSTRKRLPEDRNMIMERLAIVDRQVDKITALVSQLLDVSRIAGGHIELDPQWVELRHTVERVVERFTSSSSNSTVSLRGDAPRAFVDPFRVEQIVTNLISNAIKYGKGKPIDVELSSESGEACITVRDQGIGIDADQQARIFGRFERAVSSRQYGGFGLGLWIAHQVVEASGGRISVKSEPGQGAEFTVTLPLHAPPGHAALDQARSEAQQ